MTFRKWLQVFNAIMYFLVYILLAVAVTAINVNIETILLGKFNININIKY